jgi:thiol-disulfide isomerase/thioredoxin
MVKKTVCNFLAGMMLVLFVSVAHGATIEKMPEFSLSSALDGKVVNSKDFSGKVLLITFFATWCPPCRQEIPTLIRLQNDYGPKGFSVIGLSVDEKGPKVVVKMIRAFGGVAGIPTSFLVNRQGMIVKRYPGYVPHALLDKDIKALL